MNRRDNLSLRFKLSLSTRISTINHKYTDYKYTDCTYMQMNVRERSLLGQKPWYCRKYRDYKCTDCKCMLMSVRGLRDVVVIL